MTKNEILWVLNFVTESLMHIEEVTQKVESEVERIRAAIEAETEGE